MRYAPCEILEGSILGKRGIGLVTFLPGLSPPHFPFSFRFCSQRFSSIPSWDHIFSEVEGMKAASRKAMIRRASKAS